MTGRHEGPPIGSEAREATAAPWHGKHRADEPPPGYDLPETWRLAFMEGTGAEVYQQAIKARAEVDAALAALDNPEPDDPARCWSCGHTTDMFCECQCCNDDHDGGPDDV